MKNVVEGKLWFNASKAAMGNKLYNARHNSGVGIDVRRCKSNFEELRDYVHLMFDDGTQGDAKVVKDSWDSCTHLIDESIGRWARHNGLWERKLSPGRVSVPVYIEILDSGALLMTFKPE